MHVVTESKLAAVLGGLPGIPRVVVSGNFATPWRALAILDEVTAEYHLFALNAQPGVPDRDGVILESAFVGAGMRGRNGLRYFPCRLSLVPSLLKDALPPDVVLVHTSVPVNGTVSLGMEVNVLPAAIEAARMRGGLIVAQLNPNMPYTYGDAVLAWEEIDYAIEADTPLPSPPLRTAPDVSQAIGERAAGHVPEGATLQLGIGTIPDAVLAALTGRRGLSVWSEMFSDGVLALEKSGALAPDIPVTASFAFGTPELYDWIDRNPRVRLLRTGRSSLCRPGTPRPTCPPWFRGSPAQSPPSSTAASSASRARRPSGAVTRTPRRNRSSMKSPTRLSATNCGTRAASWAFI